MEKIGFGSYGNVFLDEKLGEAVKKCYHEDSRNIWCGNIREMDILKRCGDHPNIVSLKNVVLEDDKEHNKLTLRLKYYPNNLQNYISDLKDGRIDISTLRIIMVQLLLGLEYIHANKIIHRDLKPDNILINPETLEIALCDFGMSEILMKYKKFDSKVTAPLYRAPEVFKEEYYSSEVDLWAVGLIFFYMITGQYPYKYPLEKEKKITAEIHSLNVELSSLLRSENNKSDYVNAKKKNIERKIDELKNSIKLITLNEIYKIDIKKVFSPKFCFRKLLDGLLKEDPNKRITATQALEDSFFDSVREKYIIPTRKAFQPDPIKLQKLSIEDIPERKWITKYTMKFVSENSDYDCYPIVFHGLDIFEKYLHNCRSKAILSTKSIGKYLNEKETYLYLYTCFYISHKFYAITEIPLDYEDFFPEELIVDSNMEKAEEFEEYMIINIMKYKFFDYTLYEIAEEMINSPDVSHYYKILKEYLTISQKTQNYNSYRALYRDHIMQKSRIN